MYIHKLSLVCLQRLEGPLNEPSGLECPQASVVLFVVLSHPQNGIAVNWPCFSGTEKDVIQQDAVQEGPQA